MAEPATVPSERGSAPTRRGFSLFGPLFYYDLVRQARRGRGTLLRCAYVLALGVALRFAYSERFPLYNVLDEFRQSAIPLSPGELSSLVQRFVYALLSVQTGVVFLVTPAYVAGAIAEERERRTLSLLLTTHLSDREIVLGKLASRLVQLFGLLLAGLPLMALMQIWGGVDFFALLAAFLVTALNVASVGAVSVLCSCVTRTVFRALLASYAAAAVTFAELYELNLTPTEVFALLTHGSPVPWLDLSLTFSAAVILIPAWAAVLTLRGDREASRDDTRGGTLSPPRRLPATVAATGKGAGPAAPVPAYQLAPIGDRPLLWKEMNGLLQQGPIQDFERMLRGRPLHAPLVVAGIVVLGHLVFPTKVLNQTLADAYLSLAVLFAGISWCGVAGFRAAASVSRERDARTLDGLLTLPVTPAAILGAKWLGALLYGRGFGYFLAMALAVGLALGVLHPMGAALVVAALLAHLVFFTSAGIWLSVGGRSTVQARVFMAVILLVGLGGGLRHLLSHDPSVVTAQTRDPDRPPWRMLVAECGANAPGAWTLLTFAPRQVDESHRSADPLLPARLKVAVGGSTAFALAAGLLSLSAYWRFRTDVAR
jgi:ABC-type transport system involved in multi-copper enzyme maturation permease subunit